MRLSYLGNLASIHLVRWVNGMAGLGHQVEVLSSHQPTEQLAEAVVVHQLPWPAPLGYVANAWAVRRRLRRSQPDLLHVHFASGYGTLGTLSGFHPRILSVWGSDVYRFPARSWMHRTLISRNLAASDAVTSTSQVMADHVKKLVDRQVTVVPFGIDTLRFSPSSVPHAGDELVIGTARAHRPEYGLDILIRAFTVVVEVESNRSQVAALRLLIAGDGAARADLEKLAAHQGISDKVEFRGWLPHAALPGFLDRLDVFVAPSREESFGVAVLEASACGLPVVVSDAGGLPEVVLDGETGLIVRRENPEALAQALLRLASDPALRARLGQAGRDHVLRNYQWEASLSRMEAVYRQTLAQAAGE